MLAFQKCVVPLFKVTHVHLIANSSAASYEDVKLAQQSAVPSSVSQSHLCSGALSASTRSAPLSTKVPDACLALSPGLRVVVMRRKLIFAISCLCKSVILSESVSCLLAKILCLASLPAALCASLGNRFNKVSSSR